MAFSFSTSAQALLKELYPDGEVKNLVYADHPFLALLKKQEDMGRALIVPIIIGNTPGRSTTFADALSAKGASDARKFVVIPAKDYALATIDNLEIETSQSKKGGIVDMLKLNVDGALSALANSVSQSLFGDGSGLVGTVTTTALIDFSVDPVGILPALADINEIVNFEIGQKVEMWNDEATPVLVDTVTISAINRSTGVLTVTVTQDVAIDTYSLYIDGDKSNKLTGLKGWLPYTAPSSGDSFFSLDRSVDVTRLSGIRHDGSSVTIEKALLDGATAIALHGGRPDVCLVNFDKFNELVDVLGANVRFKDIKVANVGFEALTIRGPKGPIKVIADANCPDDYAYLLDMRSWKLASTGPAIKILDRDGKVIRESASDAYEVRCASYSQLVCDAPGWNGVVKLD